MALGAGQSNAAGATNHPLSTYGGEEKHILSVDELASHAHTLGNHVHNMDHYHYCPGVDHLHSLQGHIHGYNQFAQTPAGSGFNMAIGGGFWIGTAAANTGGPSAATTAASDRSLAFNSYYSSQTNSSFTNTLGPSVGSDSIGSGTPHNVLSPYLTLNYIIKT
jgi:microcystin-dependent protein